MEEINNWDLAVGRVRGRWDKASLRLKPSSTNPAYFAPGSRLCLQKDGQRHLITVATSRAKDGCWIVTCGLKTEAEADALVGSDLFVDSARRPPLPEGQLYLDEMLGFAVVTEAGEDLGEVEEVIETPANLVFCTPLALVPDHPDFVVKVDTQLRRITVRDVPGIRIIE
jgi:16S rRNA processing protein RimM